MKFKAEIILLVIAIALFAVSTFFYSYEGLAQGFDYPYRIYAFSFVGCGSVLMVTASISYSKRSKKTI
ncbi:MAG: hypothetical protein NWE94_00185 [Candidatus Bathyarchaeota archaeon]|nr:hypothetical protein [Candidatus Bathyarchaeota archaeon]